jgi:hypothetical protein
MEPESGATALPQLPKRVEVDGGWLRCFGAVTKLVSAREIFAAGRKWAEHSTTATTSWSKTIAPRPEELGSIRWLAMNHDAPGGQSCPGPQSQRANDDGIESVEAASLSDSELNRGLPPAERDSDEGPLEMKDGNSTRRKSLWFLPLTAGGSPRLDEGKEKKRKSGRTQERVGEGNSLDRRCARLAAGAEQGARSSPGQKVEIYTI